jgi:hypothetical protein
MTPPRFGGCVTVGWDSYFREMLDSYGQVWDIDYMERGEATSYYLPDNPQMKLILGHQQD